MSLPASPVELTERIAEIIAAHKDREGPMLPILHDIQEEWGFVPEAAQPIIAEALGLTRAEVHGVVSFYHDFRDHPSGRHVLRLCRAEACQSMGADALAAQVQAALGLDWHETTPDGRLTLEPVFCLGLCACAPSAQMGDRLMGRATLAKVQRLVAGAGA
ncbi:formate dehydrogenase subunit gamma [Paracoccus laeviglucosivorans]|uniref:Formate dehydrogenase gamma subunit n=1 Tax=Paracoccus laeviglucosivorans TaxID=1197861 RepID=A0A521CH37_9RHOB|nr:formate dehydrogenase subunit gamma [Paracoccus laeviglucosivorans]SMO58748.1 formate dehydrogenase gamma subunit [Paracoccus laeviglucosivorans]